MYAWHLRLQPTWSQRFLVVDEVLAVGDMQFQQKCLSKMGDVATEGRTVLFVSHNLEAVQRLCSRCLLLNQGGLVMNGPTDRVIEAYISQGLHNRSEYVQAHKADKPINLRRVYLTNRADHTANEFRYDEGLRVVVEYEVNQSDQWLQRLGRHPHRR